ncbi:DUF4817 domain-containing protein [Nephila pilipes]|uniref:DUF4817 domain-containing protein n=1 Tax=Nephila pilipes TaxID=299642 RepID=A0A8X6PA20_NEPPI|nr:DUF4817 domain-containing protein [Nephila pilipes]
MLSAKDKALLMKMFYMNEESATVALHKFRLQKNVKTGKGPLIVTGITKLVQRFEETESLQDRVRSGRPSLRQTRSARVAAKMETLASESSAGTSSAREAGIRLGLPPSSIHNILHGVLNQYPYKLQSCHELLPSDTEEREAFGDLVLHANSSNSTVFQLEVSGNVLKSLPLQKVQSTKSVKSPNPNSLEVNLPQMTRYGRAIKTPKKLNLVTLSDVFV